VTYKRRNVNEVSGRRRTKNDSSAAPSVSLYPLDFETALRAAMATGKPPAQKKKAAKRRPRKGGK
jgi:hypothetical protein